MNSPLPDHLSIPEAAEALGIRLRDVRALISDRRLLATRRTGHLTVSSDQLIEVDGRYDVLGSLRGTLILLDDSGFSDIEAEEWLHRDNPELGQTPIAALRSGKHRAVRRIIASLAF